MIKSRGFGGRITRVSGTWFASESDAQTALLYMRSFWVEIVRLVGIRIVSYGDQLSQGNVLYPTIYLQMDVPPCVCGSMFNRLSIRELVTTKRELIAMAVMPITG